MDCLHEHISMEICDRFFSARGGRGRKMMKGRSDLNFRLLALQLNETARPPVELRGEI